MGDIMMSTEYSVYIDGNFYPKNEAKISVFDHGLLYGDGVFEGIRSYDGKVFKLDEHLSRLYQSAKSIDLHIPITFEDRRRGSSKISRQEILLAIYTVLRLLFHRVLGIIPTQASQREISLEAVGVSFER